MTSADKPAIPDLLDRSLRIATQLLVARGGEKVIGANRLYDESDALTDAARLLTLGLSPVRMQDVFAEAARALQLPSIWPGHSADPTLSPMEDTSRVAASSK